MKRKCYKRVKKNGTNFEFHHVCFKSVSCVSCELNKRGYRYHGELVEEQKGGV